MKSRFALMYLATAILCSSARVSAATFPTSTKPDPALVQGIAQLLDESLTALYTKSSDADTAYYDSGVWVYRNHENSWASSAGVGTAAAVLWHYRQLNPAAPGAADTAKQQWLHRIAVETFDTLIRNHTNADGSFDNPAKPDTYFFNTELATTYLELGDSIDQVTKDRWRGELVKAVQYLITNDNLPNPALPGWKANGWYTNGNIELGESELVYDLWKITGDSLYKKLYEQQFALTLKPDISRWAGFGLAYDKQPMKADASDGMGYLAESGGKQPGVDWDYLQFQTTVAARLYVESGDPRVLRLINLFANEALTRVDKATWIYDATNGSRHSLKLPFTTCGLAVASWLGGRSDYSSMLPDQLKVIQNEFRGNAVQGWGSPGIYRGYGCDVAVWLMAAERAGNAGKSFDTASSELR